MIKHNCNPLSWNAIIDTLNVFNIKFCFLPHAFQVIVKHLTVYAQDDSPWDLIVTIDRDYTLHLTLFP